MDIDINIDAGDNVLKEELVVSIIVLVGSSLTTGIVRPKAVEDTFVDYGGPLIIRGRFGLASDPGLDVNGIGFRREGG